LIVTDFRLVPPLLVASQVNVLPDVSSVTRVLLHPEDWEIRDSGSVTDQLTSTSLVYQPFVPSVPSTTALIAGEVLSLASTGPAMAIPTPRIVAMSHLFFMSFPCVARMPR